VLADAFRALDGGPCEVVMSTRAEKGAHTAMMLPGPRITNRSHSHIDYARATASKARVIRRARSPTLPVLANQ